MSPKFVLWHAVVRTYIHTYMWHTTVQKYVSTNLPTCKHVVFHSCTLHPHCRCMYVYQRTTETKRTSLHWWSSLLELLARTIPLFRSIGRRVWKAWVAQSWALSWQAVWWTFGLGHFTQFEDRLLQVLWFNEFLRCRTRSLWPEIQTLKLEEWVYQLPLQAGWYYSLTRLY